MKRLPLVAFTLVMLVTEPVQAANDYSFSAERQGKAVHLRARAVVKGELGTVWRVLTDYEAYSRFIPGMHQSSVMRRKGNEATIEQRGEANLLWVRRSMHVVLLVVEDPMRSVESTLVSGSVKHLRGRYELHGRGDAVQLDYVGEVVPDDDDHVGLVELVAIRSNSSRQFEALVREIERVAGGASAGSK